MSLSYFQRVRWLSAQPVDPVVLWSHVTDHWEVRKVDEFADGRLVWADSDHESGDTRLSTVPMPSIAEIAGDPQFSVEVIDEADFERVWQRARQVG